MELSYTDSLPKTGFNFDNYERNATFAEKGMAPPRATSTGTTIVGCVYKDGVVLASDTRATGGSIVGEKNCQKLHPIAPFIYTAGAGTAADCDHVNEQIRRDMELHAMQTGQRTRVNQVVTRFTNQLFRYMGHLGCAIIIGGIDVKGKHVCYVDPHGISRYHPYIVTGSGMLAAQAIFDTRYREDMTEQEAIDVCSSAIEAGIYHDLGSGSNVDIVVIDENGPRMTRGYKSDNHKPPNHATPDKYIFPSGTTEVLTTKNFKLEVSEGEQPMEL